MVNTHEPPRAASAEDQSKMNPVVAIASLVRHIGSFASWSNVVVQRAVCRSWHAALCGAENHCPWLEVTRGVTRVGAKLAVTRAWHRFIGAGWPTSEFDLGGNACGCVGTMAVLATCVVSILLHVRLAASASVAVCLRLSPVVCQVQIQVSKRKSPDTCGSSSPIVCTTFWPLI